MKTTQRRTGKRCLFRACYGERQSHFVFGRNSRHVEDSESFKNGTRGRLQICPDWRLLASESWRKDNQKQRVLSVFQRSIFGFLQLVTKSVIDQILEVWSQSLQRLGFGFWHWLLKTVGQGSIFIYDLTID